MEITREMFDMYQTPITSMEELKIITKMCPILVEIQRSVNKNSGEFERTIFIYSKIWAKIKDPDIGIKVGDVRKVDNSIIGSDLIRDNDGNMKSSISGKFKTLEEAEQWVGERIIEIRNNRKMIIENIQKEKPSEFILIEK